MSGESQVFLCPKCFQSSFYAKCANCENADLRARLEAAEKCHPFECNPTCPACGDTPSCGDGSWRWNGKRHEHRCRDAHPQSGHDEVLCEKHRPDELIAMLRDEVKALRITRDVKNGEVDRLEKARDHAEWGRDILKAEVLAWRGELGHIDDCPEVFNATCATDLSGVLRTTAAAAVKEASGG